MKGVRFFGAGPAIDRFVDLPQALDAVALGHQREQSIVRSYKITAGACLHYDGEALSAHARIHDGNEHRPGRPELLGLVEAVSAVENARVLVAEI
jgi:hypothetical protein